MPCKRPVSGSASPIHDLLAGTAMADRSSQMIFPTAQVLIEHK